jgi:hypothetical protein
MDFLTALLAILAATLGTLAKRKWRDLSWVGRLAMILAIVASGLGAIYKYKQVKKTELIEKINSRFGDFEDLDGATIPEFCMGTTDNSWPLGPSGVWMTTQTGPLFRLYVKGGKLFIDIVIWGKDKKPIAAIDGNEWYVYNDDYEYNNDETGFEMVTKGDRRVYFQVYLKGGKAHMLGIITNKKGLGVKFTNAKGQEKDFFGKMVMIAPTNSDSIADQLYSGVDGRIFRYPRSRYLGKRLE